MTLMYYMLQKNKKNATQKLWGALPDWKTSSATLEKYVDKEFETMPNVEFVK